MVPAELGGIQDAYQSHQHRDGPPQRHQLRRRLYLDMDYDRSFLSGIPPRPHPPLLQPEDELRQHDHRNRIFCSELTSVPYPTADGAPLGEEHMPYVTRSRG